MCGGRIVVSILASAVPLPHANRPPCPSACVPVLCGLMILSIECRWGSRCIAPLVPNLSTVRKWMVSSTLRPFYHSRKNRLVSIPVFSIQKIPISLAQTRFLLILLCHVTQPPICFSEEKFSINPYAFVHCDCWFQYWLQRRADNPLLITRAVGPSTFGCPRLLLFIQHTDNCSIHNLGTRCAAVTGRAKRVVVIIIITYCNCVVTRWQ